MHGNIICIPVFIKFWTHALTYLGRPQSATICTTMKQRFNQNVESYSNGHQNRNDHNALLSKQCPYLFGHWGFFVQYFGNCLYDSRNLVGKSAPKEIDAFLPYFQLVIWPFDPIPDVFSNAIIALI